MENRPSPAKQRAHRYASTYLAIILLVLTFGFGVFIGRKMILRKQAESAGSSAAAVNLINIDRNKNRAKDIDFNQFWEVWDRVRAKYVKQPVKDSELFYGALQGLVFGLGDPYSVYFPPAPAAEFTKSLAGEFGGIGAEIGNKNNQIVVIAPLPDTPAERAGLRPADRILAIDRRSTLGMDVSTAVEHIRGSTTTTVILTIMRAGWEKPRDLTIHRATINVPSVLFSMRPGAVAYLRVMQFNEQTMPNLARYIDMLKARKAQAIILDLRNNPGGLLDGAIDVSGEIFPEGTTVVLEQNKTSKDELKTNSSGTLKQVKLVVLVNGGTASSAEIVAGAIKDHNRGKVIGEKTFGKGTVQELDPLRGGSSAKITVAKWLTPKGTSIDKNGIVPDIEVKEPDNILFLSNDPLVKRAIEELDATLKN